MGALTESEIFDCLKSNMRLAAEHCEDLGRLPRKGPTYRRLREELELIEGCCRQASAWREDTRFLPIALKMAEAHKLAGEWLRGIKVGKGPRRRLPPGQMHPMFMALASALRALAIAVDNLRTKPTGRAGMILPDSVTRPTERRIGAPVSVKLPPGMMKAPSGLILPYGSSAP